VTEKQAVLHMSRVLILFFSNEKGTTRSCNTFQVSTLSLSESGSPIGSGMAERQSRNIVHWAVFQ
jgi:hypothetical protein